MILVIIRGGWKSAGKESEEGEGNAREGSRKYMRIKKKERER